MTPTPAARPPGASPRSCGGPRPDSGEPSRPPAWRGRRRPAPASAGPAGRGAHPIASSTRSSGGSRASRRTGGPPASPRAGSARALRTRVERPLFSPHPELDVRLTKCGGQVLDLGRQFLLASRGEGDRVVAPGEAHPAALEKLLLPLGDRRLAHLQAARDLDLAGLALEHREHDRELLVGRPERLATHRSATSSVTPEDHTPVCPRKSDASHTPYTYDDAGRETIRSATAAGPTSRASLTRTFNRAGQVLTENSQITGDPTNGTTTYTYDPLERLTSA